MLTKKSCRVSLAVIAFPVLESTAELNQHWDAEPSPIVGLEQPQQRVRLRTLISDHAEKKWATQWKWKKEERYPTSPRIAFARALSGNTCSASTRSASPR
jgi:hypothetical protein